MMMRGNQKLVGGCCPDSSKQKLKAGKDVVVRDDQIRVSPHLKKLMTAKLAARAMSRASAKAY